LRRRKIGPESRLSFIKKPSAAFLHAFACRLIARNPTRANVTACHLISLDDNIDMSKQARDPGLDALLLLDGEMFFADAAGKYFVKFLGQAG
jgi:hypothetical protein